MIGAGREEIKLCKRWSGKAADRLTLRPEDGVRATEKIKTHFLFSHKSQQNCQVLA